MPQNISFEKRKVSNSPTLKLLKRMFIGCDFKYADYDGKSIHFIIRNDHSWRDIFLINTIAQRLDYHIVELVNTKDTIKVEYRKFGVSDLEDKCTEKDLCGEKND